MNRLIAIVAGVAGAWLLLPVVLNLLGLGMMSRLVGHSPIDLTSLPNLVVTLGMPVVLFVFAQRRLRAPSTQFAEYTRRHDGDAVVFEVKPAAAPLNAFAAILSVLIFLLWPATHWIVGAICIGIAALVLLRDPRRDVRARSLRVHRNAIALDGLTVAKSDVLRLGISNPFGGDVEIVYDARAGLPSGTVAGLVHRQKVGAVAYRVQLEAGGKAHVLAAGLDEVTARAVVADVGGALGLAVKSSA